MNRNTTTAGYTQSEMEVRFYSHLKPSTREVKLVKVYPLLNTDTRMVEILKAEQIKPGLHNITDREYHDILAENRDVIIAERP